MPFDYIRGIMRPDGTLCIEYPRRGILALVHRSKNILQRLRFNLNGVVVERKTGYFSNSLPQYVGTHGCVLLWRLLVSLCGKDDLVGFGVLTHPGRTTFSMSKHFLHRLEDKGWDNL